MISTRRKRMPSSPRTRSCTQQSNLENPAAASTQAAFCHAEKPAARPLEPASDDAEPTAGRVRKKRHWVDDKVMFDAGRVDMMEIALRAILVSSPDRAALTHRILRHVKVHAEAHDGTSPDAYLDGFSLQVTRLLY